MVLPLSYNVRSLWMRWPATLLAVFGIALVVLVFVAMLAMVTGFRLALRSTGRPDNAIVTQKGSAAELMSGIARDHANLIMVDSRVARGPDGQPLASPETLVMINMPKRSDGLLVNVTLRGVTPRAFDVRGGLRLVEGRMFRPGLNEIIVGRAIQNRIRGLDVGAKVTTRSIQRRDWEVVGVFASDGSAFESEILGRSGDAGVELSKELPVSRTPPGESGDDRPVRQRAASQSATAGPADGRAPVP